MMSTINALELWLRSLCFFVVVGGAGLSMAATPQTKGKSNLPKKPKVAKAPVGHQKTSFGQPKAAFLHALRLLRKEYYRSLGDEELYAAALRGVLRSLDPPLGRWHGLFSPSRFQSMTLALRGRRKGMGVRLKLNPKTGLIHIHAVMPGTPAQRAGLKVGDMIVRINDVFFGGKTMRDVAKVVRSAPQAMLRLSLLRRGRLIQVSLKMAAIRVPTMSWKVLPGGVAWIYMRMFRAKTPAQLKRLLQKLRSKGVRALILDVRDNIGGLVKSTFDTTRVFLKRGDTIVKMLGRGPFRRTFRATKDGPGASFALAVLINRRTMSGGEIFAAALSEQRRARLVGQPSSGKWSAQAMRRLPNGYWIRYTIAKYRSPKSQRISHKGLRPDLLISHRHGQPFRSMPRRYRRSHLRRDAALWAAYLLLKATLSTSATSRPTRE